MLILLTWPSSWLLPASQVAVVVVEPSSEVVLPQVVVLEARPVAPYLRSAWSPAAESLVALETA
jgi:hypothetical protein